MTSTTIISKKEYLIEQLHAIGCIKFGEFYLKSKIKTPIYFDLRLLVSHPNILKLATELINDLIHEKDLAYDIICGVPYGAIALATALSVKANKPMILKRKEVKGYGTKSMLEGQYKRNDSCLIIEDVCTTGASILETKVCLEETGLRCEHSIVVLDREQGGVENVSQYNAKLHSVLKSMEVLDVLLRKEKITQTQYDESKAFLSRKDLIFEAPSKDPNNNRVKSNELTYEARAKLAKNQVAKELFTIMANKQTNVCVAADVTNTTQLLKIADTLGPHICMLKTHVDILNDFTIESMQKLVDLSRKHRFLIFEDRKFADIGNTVQQQYTQGIFKINQWSDIVNVHSIVGPSVIKALRDATCTSVSTKACLLVAQMSSEDNLTNEEYVKNTLGYAESYPEFVMGFICQKRISDNPSFVHMTPGVQLSETCDLLGQKYKTPERAIFDDKCDVIIVGRGILEHAHPLQATIEYKNLAFNSYLKRVL